MEKYTWHFIVSEMGPNEEGRFLLATEAYVFAETEQDAINKIKELLPGRKTYFLKSCNEHDKETLSEFQKMYLSTLNGDR